MVGVPCPRGGAQARDCPEVYTASVMLARSGTQSGHFTRKYSNSGLLKQPLLLDPAIKSNPIFAAKPRIEPLGKAGMGLDQSRPPG